MSAINHQFRLAARPVGLPKRSDFNYTEEPVRDPGAGEILVKILYVSLDPAMRGWMNEGKSYIPPVGIGEVMRAGAVGRVIASQNPGFAVGDHVVGMFGMQEYALSDGKGVTKVDPRAGAASCLSGTLGMPGMTAYFGLLEVGALKAGDTVVVSGAAGAVGMPVGQIAKIKGARAVGLAGSPEKCDYVVKELGFDACINYKTEDVKAALRQHCPNGINVYFDNVGGEILDAALAQLGAWRARGDLRRNLTVQLHQRSKGPAELSFTAGEQRAHGRLCGFQLRRAICRGDARDGRLARCGKTQVAGRRRRRS